MTTTLDLHDIQGNIVKGYSRYGYPVARYLFLEVKEEAAGRQFVSALVPDITTAAPWSAEGSVEDGRQGPPATTNIAFSYQGLAQLGLPQNSLSSFPDEYVTGMEARRDILGDDGVSAPSTWDPIWRKPGRPVHIIVWFNGRNHEGIEKRWQQIQRLIDAAQGNVVLLDGHRGQDGAVLPYQDASVLRDKDGQYTPKEHFGFTDGISDPYFKGTGSHPSNVIGGGKRTTGDPRTMAGWEPLETGEFILGHKDEAFEYPVAAKPRLLSSNGSYMVYRKLHQNVGDWNDYIDSEGQKYPGGREALAAKFAGRWRNGAPITRFRSEAEADDIATRWSAAKVRILTAKTTKEREEAKQEYGRLNTEIVGFDYGEDLPGAACPLGSHTRRANPRGSLEFGKEGAFATPGALANRRRLLRRGLPYGKAKDPKSNDGNHGIIIMLLAASIRRQFEFVQQQWFNYGNDFRLASDKDPLLGNHGIGADGKGDGMMTIPGDETQRPYFCSGIKRFVETRGGEYFFIPSLTALRMIGAGIIDPT